MYYCALCPLYQPAGEQCQFKKKSAYKHKKTQAKSDNSHSVFGRPTHGCVRKNNSSFGQYFFPVPLCYDILSFFFVHMGNGDHDIIKEWIYLNIPSK